MAHRHHVVSRGHQRFFADDERIRIITKSPLHDKVIGTRDAFVEKGFNAVRTPNGVLEELEHEWARLEGAALPAIRDAIQRRDLPSEHVEIKVLMAIHVARSYHLRGIYEEAFGEYFANPLRGMQVHRLTAVFETEYGRPPKSGDLERIVRERFTEMKESNTVIVERMAAIHNKVLDILAPLYVQPVTITAPPSMEFVTGDSPVVRTTRDRIRVRVAFGDADLVYMPLSRRVGVALTTKPQEPAVLLPIDVQLTNWLVWRSALTRVACHPDADWRVSLGLTREARVRRTWSARVRRRPPGRRSTPPPLATFASSAAPSSRRSPAAIAAKFL